MAITAEEIMTERVTTIREDAPLSAALEVMQEHRIRHLPVVDGDRLVGLLVGLPHGGAREAHHCCRHRGQQTNAGPKDHSIP